MFLVRISVSADASLFSKYSKKKSSALVLNSYNFTVLGPKECILFEKRSCVSNRNIYISYIHL